MMKRLQIPVDRIIFSLRYDPETGDFYWKQKISDKVVIGRKAGSTAGKRDVRISVDGVLYEAHRLAWAIMTGEQPPHAIDHVDGDTRNNRWKNLRAATISQNGANRPMQSNNRSGTKGVYFYADRKGKPWLARLSCQGKIRLNKRFATKEEAAAAYADAARQHFGEYSQV